MSLILVAIFAGAVAMFLGRWWAVAVPAALGLAVAGVLAGTGGSLQDTPLLFVVGIATVAAACGLAIRRRAVSTP